MILGNARCLWRKKQKGVPLISTDNLWQYLFTAHHTQKQALENDQAPVVK
jgi:hypothetical protein